MPVIDKIGELFPRFGAFWSALTPILGLDKRSLAVWRMVVGLVTLGDLIVRATELHAHYSDQGIETRSDVMKYYGSDYYFTIHSINGSYYFQAFIFFVHIIFSLFMAIGYKTTISKFMVWLLIISLQEHSPFVGHGGDVYHRVILFWALFLPVSSVWSLDATLKEWESTRGGSKKSFSKKEERVNIHERYGYLSFASLGLIMHVFFCYTMSAYHKTGEDWATGMATFYALNLDFFQLPPARLLLLLPHGVLIFLTLGTKLWEKYGFICFVLPWKSHLGRILGVVGFWLMHFAFGTALRIGFFYFITTANFFAYIPGAVWEVFLSRCSSKFGNNFRVVYNPKSSFSECIGIFFSLFLMKEISVSPMPEDEGEDKNSSDHVTWLLVLTREENVEEGIRGESKENMSGFIYACRRSILLSLPAFFFEKLPISVISWFDKLAATLFVLTEFTTDAPRSKRKYTLKKEKDRSPVHERYKKFRSLMKVFKKGFDRVYDRCSKKQKEIYP
eukprot:TRINITY_DN8391_c0_g1_i1.p1 TRINITY_DN8391_c0_g1~~TRINITY_DN8391_c0_g1_i1.p1  ORF type:complete len:503 (-),score=82.30 TRINITY_DN8391_c0_g1_i1:709-2217(-)